LSSQAKEDYALVKSYLELTGAPFYDSENQRDVNPTPIRDITRQVRSYVGSDSPVALSKKFYLKEEYRNPLTDSVKGRAVASMVLNAIRSGAIYNSAGKKKKWIEPTSGNTGKGLAEIAKLLGIEFTAVFSRLDVSSEIKAEIQRYGARIITIGSDYSIEELEEFAKERGKTVHYYWTMLGHVDSEKRALIKEAVANARKSAIEDFEVKEIDGAFLIESLLPLGVESNRTPMISRVEKGEFEQLKRELIEEIPELNDEDSLVAFICNHGNSSLALNSLSSQLGFAKVSSVKGGIDALIESKRSSDAIKSNDYCPIPGSSVAKSSIEFVKKLAEQQPEEYFTFMQYENTENIRAHESTTGPELKKQIPDLDAVVCTFGTGGTATGLANYFKNSDAKVYVAFPDKPVAGIRTKSGATGLAFFEPSHYSQIFEVQKSKAEDLLKFMVQRGVFIGPSTAVALQAALEAPTSSEASNFAIIAADSIENYESEYSEILQKA
jgi:cysteine synthase A